MARSSAKYSGGQRPAECQCSASDMGLKTRDWCGVQSTTRKPQQNAYIEHYNRTVRQEWLGQYIFETIEEAQHYATRWLWTYNNEQPNMAIGGITPAMKLKTAA